MQKFELVEDGSLKFWEIGLDGTSFSVRWGRIGTEGQSQTKTFPTAEKARAEHDKLIAQKTKKGYLATPSAAAAAPAEKPKASPSKKKKGPAAALTVDRAQDTFVVSASGGGSVRLRYVEIDREVEGDPEEDADEQPRITAELHVQFDHAFGKILPKKWTKLVYLYTHDSYDGEHRTVIEDTVVYTRPLGEVTAKLGGVTMQELLSCVGKHTASAAGFVALVELVDAGECYMLDEVVQAEESGPAPKAEQRGGTVEELLARAQALIDEGIAKGEPVWDDAYFLYDERMPCLREAQAILSQLDETEPSGRSHALRGAWYDHYFHPTLGIDQPRQAAIAWSKAVEASPDRLDWHERAAFAYLRSGSKAKATPHLNKLIAADKKDPHLYFLRAHAYDTKFEKSVAELERALALDPDDWRFHRLIARQLGYLAKRKEQATHEATAERLQGDPKKNVIERWGNEAMWKAAAKDDSYDGKRRQGWFVTLGKRRR